VPNSLAANAGYSGYPLQPHKEWLKSMAVVANLPALKKTVNALEKRIAELEEQLKK
jgi:UDP-3-O-[3-hydroxymyristoyl] glucosamine N-acyltransferase